MVLASARGDFFGFAEGGVCCLEVVGLEGLFHRVSINLSHRVPYQTRPTVWTLAVRLLERLVVSLGRASR